MTVTGENGHGHAIIGTPMSLHEIWIRLLERATYLWNYPISWEEIAKGILVGAVPLAVLISAVLFLRNEAVGRFFEKHPSLQVAYIVGAGGAGLIVMSIVSSGLR